jgi:hypothetical protein
LAAIRRACNSKVIRAIILGKENLRKEPTRLPQLDLQIRSRAVI